MSISLDIERELQGYPAYQDDSPWLRMLVDRLSDREAKLLDEETEIFLGLFPLGQFSGMTLLEELIAAEPTVMKIMAERHPDEIRYH